MLVSISTEQAMDYSKMFDNVPPKKNEFAGMFGEDKPKDTKFNNLFKDASPASSKPTPVQPKPDINNMFASQMTDHEKAVMSFDPKAIYKEIVEWTKHWDKKFKEVSEGNQDLTSKMLDMNQDISRHDNKQNTLFKDVIALVDSVNKRISPHEEKTFGIFKKTIVPPPLGDDELHDFIDRVQAKLISISPSIDPFAKNILENLISDCKRLIRCGEQGMISLMFIHSSNPDDDTNNRKIERLNKVQQLLKISLISLQNTEKSIEDRFEQLEDFKSVVVPTMLTKLNELLKSGADNNVLSNSLGSILNLKLN